MGRHTKSSGKSAVIIPIALFVCIAAVAVIAIVGIRLADDKKDDESSSAAPSEISSVQSTASQVESSSEAEISSTQEASSKDDVSSKENTSSESKVIPTYDDGKWNLILVNTKNLLPKDYSVALTTLKNGHKVDSRAYPQLQAMMDDMRAEGLSPVICSSYRTYQKQEELYNKRVNRCIKEEGLSGEAAKQAAAKWVAIPGSSEHQTGLALDIVALSYQVLDKNQENTAEQKWLMANSWKYGFILRYPSDKSDITGIGYEPWHYRYVGKEAAKVIYEKGICLEEYLDK